MICNIQVDYEMYYTTISVILIISMLRPLNVSWMKELLTLEDLVLASLESMYTLMFSSLGTCNISKDLNFSSFPLVTTTHCYNNGILV